MKVGTLYLSYFAKLKDGRGDKYSVCRFIYPPLRKYLKGELKGLAPTPTLLCMLNKKEISFKSFEHLFNMSFNDPDNRMIDNIVTVTNTLKEGKDVTLYAYRPVGEGSHLGVLKNIFERLGFEVVDLHEQKFEQLKMDI